MEDFTVSYSVTGKRAILFHGDRPIIIHMIGRLRYCFTSLKRGNFGRLEAEDIQQFKSMLNANQVLTDPDSVQPYNKCYLNKYIGQSKLVLLPETT